jgi:large subunit GTPase 1
LWADYFDEQGIQYAFFSAANASALQQVKRDAATEQGKAEPIHPEGEAEATTLSPKSPSSTGSEDRGDDNEGEEDDTPRSDSSSEGSDEDIYVSADEDDSGGQTSRGKVLSVVELEALFVKAAPDLASKHIRLLFQEIFSSVIVAFVDSFGNSSSKLVVGLVGYPNVGKSSTINAMLGEKKVSVSSTPGKTKHFQTIHLSETMVLCDCPGLVFPQFTTTHADLVCDGVLPIDQIKEHTGPITLVVKRIPKSVLEATYGLSIKVRGVEEGGDGTITAENFLIAYASEDQVILYLIGADATIQQLREDICDPDRATLMKLVQRATF